MKKRALSLLLAALMLLGLLPMALAADGGLPAPDSPVAVEPEDEPMPVPAEQDVPAPIASGESKDLGSQEVVGTGVKVEFKTTHEDVYEVNPSDTKYLWVYGSKTETNQVKVNVALNAAYEVESVEGVKKAEDPELKVPVGMEAVYRIYSYEADENATVTLYVKRTAGEVPKAIKINYTGETSAFLDKNRKQWCLPNELVEVLVKPKYTVEIEGDGATLSTREDGLPAASYWDMDGTLTVSMLFTAGANGSVTVKAVPDKPVGTLSWNGGVQKVEKIYGGTNGDRRYTYKDSQSRVELYAPDMAGDEFIATALHNDEHMTVHGGDYTISDGSNYSARLSDNGNAGEYVIRYTGPTGIGVPVDLNIQARQPRKVPVKLGEGAELFESITVDGEEVSLNQMTSSGVTVSEGQVIEFTLKEGKTFGDVRIESISRASNRVNLPLSPKSGESTVSGSLVFSETFTANEVITVSATEKKTYRLKVNGDNTLIKGDIQCQETLAKDSPVRTFSLGDTFKAFAGEIVSIEVDKDHTLTATAGGANFPSPEYYFDEAGSSVNVRAVYRFILEETNFKADDGVYELELELGDLPEITVTVDPPEAISDLKWAGTTDVDGAAGVYKLREYQMNPDDNNLPRLTCKLGDGYYILSSREVGFSQIGDLTYLTLYDNSAHAITIKCEKLASAMVTFNGSGAQAGWYSGSYYYETENGSVEGALNVGQNKIPVNSEMTVELKWGYALPGYEPVRSYAVDAENAVHEYILTASGDAEYVIEAVAEAGPDIITIKRDDAGGYIAMAPVYQLRERFSVWVSTDADLSVTGGQCEYGGYDPAMGAAVYSVTPDPDVKEITLKTTKKSSSGGGSYTPDPSPSPSPSPSPDPDPTPTPGPGGEADIPAAPKSGTGWMQNEAGDIYFYKDGELKKSYWVGKVDGASMWDNTWYYVKADGKLATGMQYLDDLHGGFGWYFLQPTNANGQIGKMLTGWQWIGGEYGTGWFSTENGSEGKCTYTTLKGDWNGSAWEK